MDGFDNIVFHKQWENFWHFEQLQGDRIWKNLIKEKSQFVYTS